jgi:hypothetical protein
MRSRGEIPKVLEQVLFFWHDLDPFRNIKLNYEQ